MGISLASPWWIGQRWPVGLHLASMSSVFVFALALAFAWPAEAEVSAQGCAIQSDVPWLHLCFIFAWHLPKSRRHRSGQVYRTRPLVKSLLCIALFAMHVPCRSAVQSSILAGKRVCTGSPFQFSL